MDQMVSYQMPLTAQELIDTFSEKELMDQMPPMTEQELFQIKQHFSYIDEKTSNVEKNMNLFRAMEIISRCSIDIDFMLEPDYLYTELNRHAERVIQLFGIDESVLFDEDESESSLMVEISKMMKNYDSNEKLKHLSHMRHINDVINDIDWVFSTSRLGNIDDIEIQLANKIDLIVKKMIEEELNIHVN